MRTKTIITLLVLIVSVSFACNNSSTDSSTNKGPDRQSLSTPNTTSNTVASASNMNGTNANGSNTAAVQDNFWANAAQGGLAEVEMGKLASEKAQSPEVKKFGQMMVADHSKANSELMALAGKKSVQLPTALSSAHMSAMEDLRGLSGAEFDKAYVDQMVEAHETDVALFKGQSEDDSDPDTKAFAAKTLPTLQKHLEMIKGIQSKLNK